MQNKTIGIYLITERATRRDVYVGQGIVYDRWKAHRRKYPEELFDYRILLECHRTDLNHWEQHYIRVLKTHWSEGGNNQTWGGQFWPRPEEPLSPATRKKQSEAAKARESSLSEEERRKRSEAFKAREDSMSEEERQKRSETAKARKASLSPEEKQKWSEALRAAVTEEKRQKLAAACKAYEVSLSEEEKQKRSEAFRASITEEKRKKLSEAAKAQHARNRAAKAAAVAALEALLVS